MPYFFVVSKSASECSNYDLLKMFVLICNFGIEIFYDFHEAVHRQTAICFLI